MPRHFINLSEFDADTLKSIIKNAHELKSAKNLIHHSSLKAYLLR